MLKGTYRQRIKDILEKDIHVQCNQKIAILTRDKTAKKDKEGYYIMIKGSNHQEAVIIKSTHIPNTRTHKYMKHIWTELKGENDSNTIILGNFNTTLSIIGRKSKHKMSKDTKNKINTVDKMDLKDR